MVNTNASLLSESLSEKLLDAGISDVFFSFDSPYKEPYEAVRVGASYEKVLSNIRAFMEIKEKKGLRHVQTRASMVLPEGEKEEVLEKTKKDYIRLFRKMNVAEIGFGLPTVVGRDYAPLNPDGFFRCPDLFRRIFVFCDGAAGPCCGDWERRLIVGDAESSSIKEIWSSETYGRLRAPHLEGSYKKIPACRDCSVPYLSTLDAA
jgi:hypothetical protein